MDQDEISTIDQDPSPSTLLNTLDFSLLSPEEREDFQWNEDLGMYALKDLRDKYIWSPEDLEESPE